MLRVRGSPLCKAVEACSLKLREAAYEEGSKTLYRFLLALLRNEEDAKDALQNTFVQFYRTIDRFDRSRPVIPWLITIGRNLART